MLFCLYKYMFICLCCQTHKRRMKRLIFVVAFVHTLLTGSVGAQDAGALSLPSAIERARRDNPMIGIMNAKIGASAASFKETSQSFLPQVSVSTSALFTNSPLNAFGFKLQQERVTQSDFNPSLLNDPGAVENYLTQVEALVPLINLDGWKYRQAAREGMSAAQLQKVHAENTLAFYVTQVYYGIQLVEANREVLFKAQAAMNAALVQVRNNIEAGYAKKSDELAVLVKISELESQLLQLEDQKAGYTEQLNQLMNTDPASNWTLSDQLPVVVESQGTTPNKDLSLRADMQAWQKGLAARTLSLEAQKAKYLPSLNGFANYGLNDDKFLGTNGDNYLVGLQLKWDIFSGLKRQAGAEKAQAELAQTQAEYAEYKAKAYAELAQAVRSIDIQQKEVAASERALEQSEEAYRILKDRHEQGLERTLDLLGAETTRSTQKVRKVKALYQLLIAQKKLEYLTQTINQ